MSHFIRKAKDIHFQIDLEDEAPNCHTLPMAPDRREPALDSGIWVVAAFALWSGPDLACIDTVLNVARDFVGSAALGLRMFVDFGEFDTWCPELMNRMTSPVWLFLRDGMLVSQHGGLLNASQLQETIHDHVGSKMKWNVRE